MSDERMKYPRKYFLIGIVSNLIRYFFLTIPALILLILGIFVLANAPGFGPFSAYLLPVTVIAVAGTLVESLPLKDVDNITVTLAAVILGHLLFK